MAKHVPWDLILELVGRFEHGASLEEILIGLGPETSRRTLQRRLSLLVKEKRLSTFGQARARKYLLLKAEEKEDSSKKGSLIPLTEEAKQIQILISQPIQSKSPIGYRRAFLENYEPNQTWYLKEADRKELHILGKSDGEQVPAGTHAKQIFHRLLIDLSWNSSRLEGNSYSLLETERLLDLGKAAEGKDLQETQMILNHKAAIEFLIKSANEIGINRYTILNLHTLLSDNLLSDQDSCGRLRSISVGIAKSVYLPSAIPQVVEESFNLILSKAIRIIDPFEQAFFLMVQLPYLQPFDDVNKRTSRLAANIPLIQKNLCPLAFIDVPKDLYINGLLGVYELNRIELLRDLFIWAYQRSCALYSVMRRSIGEPDPFRMKYRSSLLQIVSKVVHSRMHKTQAIDAIRKWSQSEIPISDRPRFIEVAERELQSLHEGNIARYQLLPIEYEAWKKTWY